MPPLRDGDIDSDCFQGASWALRAAVSDARIKALATVAGFYVNHDDWVEILGGEAELQKRLRDGDAAMRKWKQSGQVKESGGYTRSSEMNMNLPERLRRELKRLQIERQKSTIGSQNLRVCIGYLILSPFIAAAPNSESYSDGKLIHLEVR